MSRRIFWGWEAVPQPVLTPLAPLSDWPSDSPCLTRNRRKHCANALSCGAYPCGDPFAGLPVEGFLASEILYPSAISAMSDFHKRFDIEIDIEEARKRFIERARNEIFEFLPRSSDSLIYSWYWYTTRLKHFATALGERYHPAKRNIISYIRIEDYNEVLRAIEIIYANADSLRDNARTMMDYRIEKILWLSEIDLGIKWENGKFIPKGAELLEERLVNDSLDWLRRNGHLTVVEPFGKAFHHFLEAGSRPEVLSDVITDVYEALEALAKIILDNNQELSKNREKFMSKPKGKEFYKKILKEYVAYGTYYRHACRSASLPVPKIL